MLSSLSTQIRSDCFFNFSFSCIFFILLICFYFLTIISSWLNILSPNPHYYISSSSSFFLSFFLYFLSPLQSSGFAFLVEKCAGERGRIINHKLQSDKNSWDRFFMAYNNTNVHLSHTHQCPERSHDTY